MHPRDYATGGPGQGVLVTMRFSSVRRYAMSLPEVEEAPHHHLTSFRVRGRIFLTAPSQGDYLHLFLPEPLRDQAIAMHPQFLEKLYWGGKVVGLKVHLDSAVASVVRDLMQDAWTHKAPKTLRPIGPKR